MTLNETIKDLFGTSVGIEGRSPLSGGDINDAYMLLLSDGTRVFLKENSGRADDFFTAEADGLKALGTPGVIDTAEVLAYGRDGNTSFLLLSYIEKGAGRSGFWYEFGRKLALLHDFDAALFTPGGSFGFTSDNYIGATRQVNAVRDTWIAFFRECRLEPQFRSAEKYFDMADIQRIRKLMDHLDTYLAEPSSPSLLHGDLWGGNFMVNKNGDPVLIDPAVYVGHAEADLAMTELFGGFAKDFYKGYHDNRPSEPGYEDRRSLYNLYHLLNHLNLFGSGYLSGVLQTVRRYA